MTACAGGHRPPAEPATPQIPPTPLPRPTPPPEAVASPTPPAVQRETASLTGVVTYRQRIALPPNAVVRVTLTDVSLQDVAAKVLTEIEVPTDGRQVPIPFRLAYWPERIEATHTYSVRAQIVVDGALFMTSTTSYPVITRGAPTKLTIVVQPVN